MALWIDIVQITLALGAGWLSWVLVQLVRSVHQSSFSSTIYRRRTSAPPTHSAASLLRGQIAESER